MDKEKIIEDFKNIKIRKAKRVRALRKAGLTLTDVGMLPILHDTKLKPEKDINKAIKFVRKRMFDIVNSYSKISNGILARNNMMIACNNHIVAAVDTAPISDGIYVLTKDNKKLPPEDYKPELNKVVSLLSENTHNVDSYIYSVKELYDITMSGRHFTLDNTSTIEDVTPLVLFKPSKVRIATTVLHQVVSLIGLLDDYVHVYFPPTHRIVISGVHCTNQIKIVVATHMGSSVNYTIAPVSAKEIRTTANKMSRNEVGRRAAQ